MSKIEKKYIYILMGLLFCLYLLWSYIIPFNAAPDEFQRFDIVNFIFKYHKLPVAGDKRLIYGSYGITYAAFPCLPYIISGYICIVADFIGITLKTYIVARFLSVISGTLTIYFVFLICKKKFPNSFLKYFIPVFIGFIPEFAFVCAYVNQDAFMVLLTSVAIYLWIIGEERNWDYKTIILLAIVNGIIFLSYMNGYAIVFSTFIVVMISYKKKDREFFKKFLLFIVIVFCISGWWFIRNAYLYNGDLLGFKTNRILSEKLALPQYKPDSRVSLHKQGVSLFDMLQGSNWLLSSYKSFWACMGYMDLYLSSKYYLFMVIFNGLSFIGLSYIFVNNLKKKAFDFANKTFEIGNIINIVMAFALSLYYSLFNDYQPQGRYLYPGLVSIIIFLAIGIDTLFDEKYKKFVYIALIFIFINLNFYSLFKVVFPHYYLNI